MRQPITDENVLLKLEAMTDVNNRMVDILKEREKLNREFSVAMDAVYGEYGWQDVDIKAKTVLTEEEIVKSYYTAKNPQVVEKVELPEDVVVEEVVVSDNMEDVATEN